MEDREVEGRGRRERGRSGKHGGDGERGRRLEEREASCLLGRGEKDDRYSPT